MQAYLQGWGALQHTGLYSSAHGYAPWQEEQNGARDVRRAQVHQKPFTGFGKLQIADRLAFSAASLAWTNTSLADPGSTGISMGTVWGSLSTDIRYMESVAAGFPRPAYFSATLPSSPVAEVAIQFGLKGPNRVIVGGECPGLQALDCALSLLGAQKASSMLVLHVCALDSIDESSVLAGATQRSTYARALLLTAQVQNGGRNKPITLEGKFLSSNVVKAEEESYFSDCMRALAQSEEYASKIETAHFKGHLTIEKGPAWKKSSRN